MTSHRLRSSVREWTRRLWGACTRRRSDVDLERELAAHVAFAEDELVRKGHAPAEAARLARARAGGVLHAVDAMREQRGLPWLDSWWLDVRLGCRLLLKNWGLTLVGGLAMSVAIAIAAVVFAAFEFVMRSPLPLDDGDRVVAIQVWDREAGRRRDTTAQDLDRWRTSLRTIEDVGVFQAIRRNVITEDGGVALASVAEISAAGLRTARVSPLFGRMITEADAAPGAAPVVVIGYDVWQQRFAGARDVIGREVRLGPEVHTVVGVMPEGFRFPLNFRYWVPLRRAGGDEIVRNTGPEGAVFGRLSPGATIERAHAEVSALGLLPRTDARPSPSSIGARVVPYTFAFTGDFEPGDMGLLWSVSSLLLALLLLPPCANIAILNYARTVTRQQEFAARHALGGSRARIVSQLFIEALVPAAASAVVALLVLRVVSVVVNERLQHIPGGAPFWLTFGVSYRTVLFVAALAVAGAAVSGAVPALQATRRLSGLGAGALAGRTSLRLGVTWTTLVIAQVAFSVGLLPLAAELTWGTVRSGLIGPGFEADAFATATVALADGPMGETRHRELTRRLLESPGILGVTAASGPPGEEPWRFVEIEGRAAPAETVNGTLPGFLIRSSTVDAAYFGLYDVPLLAGRTFTEADAAPEVDAVIVNRNLAETIAPGGNALGHRFRYVHDPDDRTDQRAHAQRWLEVVGVVGNLPVTTEARVAYQVAAPGQLHPVHLQLRLGADVDGLADVLRTAAADVDPALHVEEVRTLADIYREHRFGDTLGAITSAAVTGSVLLLSGAGLYALMAFTIAQRRREIGIRTALGARRLQLMAAVLRRVCWQVGLGVAVGLTAAWIVGVYVPIERIGGRAIPGILPAAAGVMWLVGILAALGPARRGLEVDPAEALRG